MKADHYLRDIRIGYFYNYKKIGLVSTADLQYIIPDKPKEPKDFKRFKKSINPALSQYKCKTYYHTYRDRNRYNQGIMVYELNDNLNLVFEIKCYENYYDAKVDEMHEIIKAVKVYRWKPKRRMGQRFHCRFGNKKTYYQRRFPFAKYRPVKTHFKGRI
jgi:hypothetical protein